MIEKAHDLYPDLSIEQLCHLFAISRNWYYEQKGISEEEDEEETALRDRIEEIILEFPGYGYRRVTRALSREGTVVNHKRYSYVKW